MNFKDTIRISQNPYFSFVNDETVSMIYILTNKNALVPYFKKSDLNFYLSYMRYWHNIEGYKFDDWRLPTSDEVFKFKDYIYDILKSPTTKIIGNWNLIWSDFNMCSKSDSTKIFVNLCNILPDAKDKIAKVSLQEDYYKTTTILFMR